MAPAIKRIEKDAEVTYCFTVPLRKKNVFYRLANGLSFAVSSVCSLRKAGKIDIVLTTTPPALISMAGWVMAKIKHARLVYDVRDIWPGCRFGDGGNLPRTASIIKYSAISGILCCAMQIWSRR